MMKRLFAQGQWGLIALLALGTTVAITPRASAAAGYSSVILADKPLGYWRLGESDPGQPAKDASGNGNDGTYAGGITLGQAGAISRDSDTAAAFDGSTGYVDIPSSAGGTFDLANSFSLEAWVINKGQFGSGQAGRIFSNRQPGYGLGIVHTGGTTDAVRFTTFGVKDYDSNATIVPEDGNWHHLVVVFDSNNTATFYLDGNFTDAIGGPGPANSSGSHLWIGSNPVSPEYFNGSIDEAAIYNYELTASQVKAHFQAGAPYPAVVVSDTPLGYWRLGESDPSQPAKDASGNGNDGIYNGGITLGQTGAINGDPNTAALFDGSSGYVDIPSGGAGGTFDLLSSFSLEAWVINAGQFGSGQAGRILSNRQPGYGFGIIHAGGTTDAMRFTTFAVKDYDSNATIVPEDGNWHHVVVVFDSSYTATFYLDGRFTEAIPGPGPAHSSASDLWIGSNPASPEWFNGSIDEAAVYSYELTAAQVQAHFQAGQ
ncbi:MAG TPA: LamG domain-containing protein [Gemmataceae bacterium]|nr:LamG domain-containing protein [Gemmataceae bacterium]